MAALSVSTDNGTDRAASVYQQRCTGMGSNGWFWICGGIERHKSKGQYPSPLTIQCIVALRDANQPSEIEIATCKKRKLQNAQVLITDRGQVAVRTLLRRQNEYFR